MRAATMLYQLKRRPVESMVMFAMWLAAGVAVLVDDKPMPAALIGQKRPADPGARPEELLISRIGEHGESHLARARVHIALGEAAAGARSLCDAIARSPSLVEAHVMLADNLLDIGRLPDASRRLDIALALDRSSVYAWICRARQFAYQERWDELRTLATESFPEVALRGVLPRLLLWHPDRDLLESLERLLAANHELPRPVWQGAQLLVAFALAREDRGALIDRLVERFEPSTNMRRNAYLAQVLCELACAHGQLSRALEFLAAADGYLVTDWQWIERCPLLAPIRGRPEFAAVREHVRVRADAIADAIWG